MRTTTVRAHRRSFETAPRVRAGEVVRVLRNDGKHPGWFFGDTSENVEGYFPVRWFDFGADATATARRDYDATELTIEVGVPVQCLEAESSWVRVRTVAGEEGWIPEACLAQEPPPD